MGETGRQRAEGKGRYPGAIWGQAGWGAASHRRGQKGQREPASRPNGHHSELCTLGRWVTKGKEPSSHGVAWRDDTEVADGSRDCLSRAG